MKKAYTKPVFSCEYFEVSTNIASNCGTVVNMGPQDPTRPDIKVCSDFAEMFGMQSDFSGHGSPIQGNFYKGNCDCYLAPSKGILFTS